MFAFTCILCLDSVFTGIKGGLQKCQATPLTDDRGLVRLDCYRSAVMSRAL